MTVKQKLIETSFVNSCNWVNSALVYMHIYSKQTVEVSDVNKSWASYGKADFYLLLCCIDIYTSLFY